MAIDSAQPSPPPTAVVHHSPSTKSQPCRALTSPTCPKTLEQSREDPRTDVIFAERVGTEAALRAHAVTLRRTSRERMKVFAERGKDALKRGKRLRPPLEIINYPDLLGRAWGWDKLLPYSWGPQLSLYKKYLRDYYVRHIEEAITDPGNGLATLADSCIEMEGKLMHLWEPLAEKFEVDEKSLSSNITGCVRQMINMKCDFPIAALALKCITTEAELMCKWLTYEPDATYCVETSSKIREFALIFMTYQGTEYVPAAAIMMGIIKEAQLMCGLVLQARTDENGDLFSSCCVRNSSLIAMFDIYKEHSAEKESTGVSTAAYLICDESDDKNSLEKLVEKDDQEEGNVVNQKIKDCVVEKLAKGDRLDEWNKINQIAKSCSKEELKGGNLKEGSEIGQSFKLQHWLDIAYGEEQSSDFKGEDEEQDGQKQLPPSDHENQQQGEKKPMSSKDEDEEC